uniref:Uncharacterized protein n=1 Tax=Populus trichocarpa TaxID=3694 RepID=A0A2K1WSI2_POPTR
MKSENLNGKNVKSLCLGYLKQYGWNSKDLKICAPNVHSLSLWGELDFEDYMIEDRSCTCQERVELGFHLKLENLVDDEAFNKLLRSAETWLRKWELPGTFHLLRSSPELEPLTLEVTSSSYVYQIEFLDTLKVPEEASIQERRLIPRITKGHFTESVTQAEDYQTTQHYWR